MYGLNFAKFIDAKIINGHIHFENISLIKQTFDFFHMLSIEKLGIVSLADLKRVNNNPQAICFKAMYPQDTYVMGGLDYTDINKYSGQKIRKTLADQVLKMLKIGFDGVKLIETKPSISKNMPFNIDDPVYDSFFGLLEERQLPIVWHVADPEEFWDERTIPPAAKMRGWDYSNGTYPPKEEFHQRVERVLNRFPNLKVVFAHFCFLSANLSRASTVMDTYPHINFDITPGAAIYCDFSKKPENARDFFIKYQDRVLFGDDTTVEENISREGIAKKIFFMRNFLETDEEFLMPQGDKYFLPRKDRIRGIKLPKSVLNKIYYENFLRIFGKKPRALDVFAGKEECHRIGRLLEMKYHLPNERNFAYKAENFLSSIKS